MTQADAKNAVKRINKKLSDLLATPGLIEGSQATFMILDVIHDVDDLDRQLSDRKQATPNCRPVTAAELQHLCAASNVVTFNPAA